MIEMVGYSFQGQARWINLIAWIKSIFFVVAAALSAVQFFRADAVRSQIA